MNAGTRPVGRPPETVTLTVAEFADVLGISPSGVLKRIERGQSLVAKPRYSAAKRVIAKPKCTRSKTERAKPMPRDQVVSGLISRANDPEAHETLETLLVAAYNAGTARRAA